MCNSRKIVAALLLRWMEEREDMQIPPELREECCPVKGVSKFLRKSRHMDI